MAGRTHLVNYKNVERTHMNGIRNNFSLFLLLIQVDQVSIEFDDIS